MAWALVDDAGTALAEGRVVPGERCDLPEGEAPQRLIAVAPAEAVHLSRLRVPARSTREAAQAAPFLIEDRLAAPVEAVCVACGAAGADGQRWIFAVEQGLAARWKAAVSGTGVRPVHLLPDALLLDRDGADLALARFGDRIVFLTEAGDIRAPERSQADTDAQSGGEMPCAGALDAAMAPLLAPALAALIQPASIVAGPGVDTEPFASPGGGTAVRNAPALDLATSAGRFPDDALLGLPALFGAALATRMDWGRLARPWRFAAALSGLAVALSLASLFAEAVWFDNRAEAYRAATTTVFTEAFPDVRRVVNPRAQTAQRLAELGAADRAHAFLDLSRDLAGLLAAAPEIRIEAVRYDAERDALAVTALYGTFADFEALRAAAETSLVELEDGGARQGADGVVGDFLVSRRP